MILFFKGLRHPWTAATFVLPKVAKSVALTAPALFIG